MNVTESSTKGGYNTSTTLLLQRMNGFTLYSRKVFPNIMICYKVVNLDHINVLQKISFRIYIEKYMAKNTIAFHRHFL